MLSKLARQTEHNCNLFVSIFYSCLLVFYSTGPQCVINMLIELSELNVQRIVINIQERVGRKHIKWCYEITAEIALCRRLAPCCWSRLVNMLEINSAKSRTLWQLATRQAFPGLVRESRWRQLILWPFCLRKAFPALSDCLGRTEADRQRWGLVRIQRAASMTHSVWRMEATPVWSSIPEPGLNRSTRMKAFVYWRRRMDKAGSHRSSRKLSSSKCRAMLRKTIWRRWRRNNIRSLVYCVAVSQWT